MNTTTSKKHSVQAILDRAEYYGMKMFLDEHRNNVIVEYPSSIDPYVLIKALDVIKDNKEAIVEELRWQRNA